MTKATLTLSSKKLFVLVAPRLADGEVLRARFRRDRYGAGTMRRRARKSCCCRRRSWCPCLRHDGADRVGHAGHRRVPQRIDAASEFATGGSRQAGALPLDLRRNPFPASRLCGRHCRSNIKGHFPNFKNLVAGAGGHRANPVYLARMPCRLRRSLPVSANAALPIAMYAPVVTRFMDL